MSAEAPVRVLIVDDSAVARRVLSSALDAYPGIEVAGTAPDAATAVAKIAALSPDVVTLDIEMPGTDGVTFLRELEAPVPVVIVSGQAAAPAARARLVHLGAASVVAKPGGTTPLTAVAQEVADAVFDAAARGPRPVVAGGGPATAACDRAPVVGGIEVVAIGASAGGTDAIAEVLRACRPDAVGTVIVQHMPEGFTAAYARQLDSTSVIAVSEARKGDVVARGRALLAPGGAHLAVRRRGAELVCDVHRGPSVNRHKPSVDVLFDSVAATAGPAAVGVLLTGMGSDGAAGLLRMREAGAHTIAQDEATSLVYGMPRAAAELGAAVTVCPLGDVAAAIGRASQSVQRIDR
ncbi:MAG: chemotaxis-specific protein-glutamate methyltransferase CheB [Acidimicrobiia bacterium]